MTSTTTIPAAPAVPARGTIRPLGQGEVRITGGFWGRRQEVNGSATLAHIEGRLESEGWLPNFDLAAQGALPEGRRGREFADSEVYKYLEALAWEIGRTGDPDLEERFRAVVARVAAAQEADGYLNTMFGREGQESRWANLEWGHELYCLGHLFQAAVARERTRPGAGDGLLDVARRAADLVCAVFGEDGIRSICGHAEVELGLVELARLTGDDRYLAQAALFVERHGEGSLAEHEWGRSYYQDDMPVRDAEALRGHAVRANYLSAAAVDVAVDTGDEQLLGALRRQWERTVARRTYITGGQGSHHQDEAFGDDWELPPDRAYSETCASIGSVMFTWRLFLAGGDARYADLIERSLYNVVETSPSADGTSFYYANTLHERVPGTAADPDATSPRASSSLRAPWFEVSCCPPNVARTFASLDTYVATATADGVRLLQYAPAEVRMRLEDGTPIEFDVETAYPENGLVRVIVRTDAEFTLGLRVPSWGEAATLRVRSAGDVVEHAVAPGFAEVRRAFSSGDVVELDLPVGPRISVPDSRIDAVRGCVAIERGPEVLALESVDLAAVGVDDVSRIVLDASTPPVERDGRTWVRVGVLPEGESAWPYGAASAASPAETFEVPLVAYHDWAERGPSTMRVFLPVM